MLRTLIVAGALIAAVIPRAGASDKKPSDLPTFDYDVARSHEIKPHRRSIPSEGVHPGFHQLHLFLIVSTIGNVVDADASGEAALMALWPQLKSEVLEWRFVPFEQNGKATTARVEEYLDLVSPERLPKRHIAPPILRANSKVSILLERSGCFGSCPSYTVTLTTQGIVFVGEGSVVAIGQHSDAIDADQVRKLAQNFIAADFYSMDASYFASVTDNPIYTLSIDIDGRKKSVTDYVGTWEGMPAVIGELEDEVDELAQTKRWIEGSDGMVDTLKAEGFEFKSFEAQAMLKQAAMRGQTQTVRDLLAAGVSLQPIPQPKTSRRYVSFYMGWLTTASSHPDTLQVLMDAAASRNDQSDKDHALAGAARSGKVEAVRALIAYGANANADLSPQSVAESSEALTMEGPGAGSILIYAAESGNPEMVREILRYHPKMNARDSEGRTALFAASEYRDGDEDGARVQCVRLLVQAGANVNARDDYGNTPLHETFLSDVEEELLKLGADVNARNKDGETPIFTTVDDEAIPLFIQHGADLALRNKKGQTVLEAAEGKGPARLKALKDAIEAASGSHP
jgi:ankyrin repeat protein